jgi:hypothetical protein
MGQRRLGVSVLSSLGGDMSDAASTPQIGKYSYDKRKLCARIDITRASQADNVNIGDEVTITLKGRVKMLKGPEKGMTETYGEKDKKSKPYIEPGVIEIECDDMKVAGTNEWVKVMNDGDDD